jgi:hypothetical protein
MFEDPTLRRVRRRAYHVRGILGQLLGTGSARARHRAARARR